MMIYHSKKHSYIVAIDPDVERSGVACLRLKSRNIEVSSLTFPELLDYLQQVKRLNDDLIVLVEAGWLIQSNWHLNKKDNRRTASAKGNSTGRNHEVGRKIVEMCKHYEIDVQEIKPLKKCWKGRDGKITHEELALFVPIEKKRTNQEERDAAYLAWNYAGLPIRIKPT